MTGRLVRLAAASLVVVFAANADAGEPGGVRGGPVETAAKAPDRRTRPHIRTRAIRTRQVKDTKVGRPRRSLRGAHFITRKQWRAMAQVPASGLYIVDMRSVPRELPGLLEGEAFRLARDGKLTDREGAPIALFVQTRYYRLSRARRRTETAFPQLADAVLGQSVLPLELAQYADRFGCIGVSAWLIYRGGKCTGYEARTLSFAYGACRRRSRRAVIDLIEARVDAGRRNELETCFNCTDQTARLPDIGACFWPGHEQARKGRRGGRGPHHSAYFGASRGMQRVNIDWYWLQR
jgi:hypothetical protein